MANIRVDVDYTLIDGQPLTFKAPCGFGTVNGLKIYYPEGETTSSKVFTFRDTHGNTLTGTNLFVEGTYVKVLLDTVNNYAYPQNADTNAYLEGRFDEKAPAYTYGTEDLTAGTSTLETGKLHFVYE